MREIYSGPIPEPEPRDVTAEEILENLQNPRNVFEVIVTDANGTEHHIKDVKDGGTTTVQRN